MTSTHRQNFKQPCHKQRGYILPMVSLFMIILLGSSTQFFFRATDSSQMTGNTRDSGEAILLSESALNMLMGGFANTLDSDNDTFTDQIEAAQIQINKDTPNAVMLPYMFYVSTGNGIDQNAPSLLQKVANGESIDEAASNLTTPQIDDTTIAMRINDLFASNVIHPTLYSFNNNGLLIDSTMSDWDSETNYRKAAVWFEITENTSDANAIDIYVQSVAQVGLSKSYLQRYIGSYFASITIGGISVLSEASNINRN